MCRFAFDAYEFPVDTKDSCVHSLHTILITMNLIWHLQYKAKALPEKEKEKTMLLHVHA